MLPHSPAARSGGTKGAFAVQIKITARHGHLLDENQQFIREKAEKLLHYFERITLIEVTVDLQKDGKQVEFLVQCEHKHDLVASERHAELHAAVDLALAKIESKIRKYKEKIQDHRRTPSASEVAGAPVSDTED